MIVAAECFELGKHAYQAENFYHSIHWMEEAMMRMEPNSTVTRASILDYLSFCLHQVRMTYITNKALACN